MVRLLCITFFVFVIYPFCIYGQKSQLKLADIYFEAGKYQEAAKIYTEQDKKVRKDTRLLIRRGISHYQAQNPAQCIRDMEAARKLKTRDKSIFKYAGLAAMDLGDYMLAADYLKYYLRFVKAGTPEFEDIVHQIRRCGKAPKLRFEPAKAFVQNMGSEVNTSHDDFSPVQSPTRHDRLYFSSGRENSQGWLRDRQGLENPVTGSYFADIYYTETEGGIWNKAKPVSTIIHSPAHEWIQGFSSDGSIMYYVKTSDMVSGQLLTDTFGAEKPFFNTPGKINIPFSPESGDRDLQVFSDSFIVFSSQRSQGFGGYDLYWSKKTGDYWEDPVNFGKSINSSFDEFSPFLTKNGKILYFSSDRTEGAGGMDIYKAQFSPELRQWYEPQNMALPLNSTKNDLGWKVSADGTTGYFYSDRLGGLGKYDIFMAFLNEQETNQLEYTEMPEFSINEEQISAVNTESKSGIDTETKAPYLPVTPVREFISTPFYFKPNEDIFTPQNIILARRIVELMQIFPELKVVLSAHTSKGPRREVDLFSSLKNTEKIADFIKSRGISPERIFINAYGSDLPFAKHLVNGITSNLALRYNNRVDVAFKEIPGHRLNVIQDTPVISDEFRDQSIPPDSGITYSIKLLETAQMYAGDALLLETPLRIYKQYSQNLYNYTIGIFSSIHQALEFRQIINKQNICQTCTVLPFLNGVMMTEGEVKKMAEIHPELLLIK
jgi:outer membrane protein OmpA-like peptidoglycan-associated protein